MRLIFSARDAAAALYVAPLARLAAENPQHTVTVLAQQPAFGILSRAGMNPVFIEAPAVNHPHEPAAEALLNEAAHWVTHYQPDAIVTGLSSPGQGGIDEALLKVAECPTFLLQDFWGELNSFFEAAPTVYLVLDAAASELTTQRHGGQSFIMGSPRHAHYSQLDIPGIRQTSRAKLNVNAGRVIGWFGQSLHHISGYTAVIEQWVAAVESLAVESLNDASDQKLTILYKPHPRESEAQRQRTLALLSVNPTVPVRFLEDWPVEDALIACDCVCSIMSNCLYDAAYLNFYSQTPLLSPVSVLTSKALLDNLSAQIAFEALPYSRLNLANTILPADVLADSGTEELRQKLAFALSPAGIETAWLNARRHLVSPTDAAAETLIFIQNFTEQNARRKPVVALGEKA